MAHSIPGFGQSFASCTKFLNEDLNIEFLYINTRHINFTYNYQADAQHLINMVRGDLNMTRSMICLKVQLLVSVFFMVIT